MRKEFRQADRRAASRVEFTDGNGGRAVAYNLPTLSKTKTVLGILASIVGIVVTVGTVSCAGVRVGLDASIHHAIDRAVQPPNGVIHEHIEQARAENRRLIEDGVRDQMTDLERRMIDLTAEQRNLVREIADLKVEVRDLRNNGKGHAS